MFKNNILSCSRLQLSGLSLFSCISKVIGSIKNNGKVNICIMFYLFNYSLTATCLFVKNDSCKSQFLNKPSSPKLDLFIMTMNYEHFII